MIIFLKQYIHLYQRLMQFYGHLMWIYDIMNILNYYQVS